MEPRNQTAISEFLLLGLTDDPELQPLIFILFLSMYLATILGNLLIILAVRSDSHLHTPMYIFLSILSINDMCLSTTTIPHMLVSIQTQDQSIFYRSCLAQICLVLFFGNFESCLLAVMAYDRYVAICHPLRYIVIMSTRMCLSLSLFPLVISIMDALLHSLMILRLSFCTELSIPHFFCELAQIIRLTCSDTLVDNIVLYVAACILGGVPAFGIMLSYIHVVSSILRMPSSERKYKAFSTCGSHLLVVTLFYGTGLGVYISSFITNSSKNVAVASVMYSVVPQMMNPFIYSLRNRDMQKALWKLINRIASLLQCESGLELWV
ncbi:olfactory receptor 7G2 [Heterocephalus glaber]|uniref:Olfactory receptor n=1 Tax=Heterocephalus glaber TaxID=10181 RepID=A0AAX6Q5I2_HETGA|nr:olfactory receptor 7G2 [Heterocephalus glaber]